MHSLYVDQCWLYTTNKSVRPYLLAYSDPIARRLTWSGSKTINWKLALIINNPYNKTSVLNIKQKATHLKLMTLCNLGKKWFFNWVNSQIMVLEPGFLIVVTSLVFYVFCEQKTSCVIFLFLSSSGLDLVLIITVNKLLCTFTLSHSRLLSFLFYRETQPKLVWNLLRQVLVSFLIYNFFLCFYIIFQCLSINFCRKLINTELYT